MKTLLLALVLLLVGCDKFVGYERHQMKIIDIMYDTQSNDHNYWYLHIESISSEHSDLKFYWFNPKCYKGVLPFKPGDTFFLTLAVYENDKKKIYHIESTKELTRYCKNE